MNKRLKKILVFFIIINIVLIFGFISTKTSASSRDIRTDINGIDDNKYPGIKAQIQSLQKNHPNWTFKVEYTGLDWNEVITAEHQGHGIGAPSNLVEPSSSRTGLWICEICGNQKYDTGKYCASKEALEYMMDPRNSVNESDLFQFMELAGYNNSNSGSVKSDLEKVKPSWVDSACIDAIIEAGNEYKISPYYILAKLKEEQSGTSPLYTGNGYKGSYEGYYNAFNVGATGSGTDNVILNGLAYAAGQGWNTRRLSVLGGVKVLKKGYIDQGQDTLYYQKFDIIGSDKYSHQYQQNVLGAQNAGTFLKQFCPSNGNYSFIIPLYENMPKTKCPRPATDQEHKQGTSDGLMGDVNGDGKVNIADAVVIVNYINGETNIAQDRLSYAKVTGNDRITIADSVKIVNYINGETVLPSGGYTTGTIKTNSSINVRLSPNGTVFESLKNGVSIKILQKASNQINGHYWDLIVTSNGIYGYIAREYYQ